MFLPCCPSPQAVEKLVQGAESGCHSEKEKQVVLNCSRLLTRVLPYIFEDPDWRGFFWSTVPGAGRGGVCGPGQGVGGPWQSPCSLGSVGWGLGVGCHGGGRSQYQLFRPSAFLPRGLCSLYPGAGVQG